MLQLLLKIEAGCLVWWTITNNLRVEKKDREKQLCRPPSFYDRMKPDPKIAANRSFAGCAQLNSFEWVQRPEEVLIFGLWRNEHEKIKVAAENSSFRPHFDDLILVLGAAVFSLMIFNEDLRAKWWHLKTQPRTHLRHLAVVRVVPCSGPVSLTGHYRYSAKGQAINPHVPLSSATVEWMKKSPGS